MLYIKWVSGRLQDKANVTLIANEVEAFYTNVNGDGNLVHTVQCNHTLEKIIGQIRSGAPDSRILLNAAAYAKPSAADQEHMDPENHRLLAEAIYQKVIEIEGILG